MRTNGSDPGAFDDERLLAYALGLDDPELAAAADRDVDLQGRLAALAADLAQVGARVRAVVPEPAAGYTDLGDPRWATLRDHLSAEPRPAHPRGARRWLRVAVPAAVVLALAVGVTVVWRGGAGGGSAGHSNAAGVFAPQAVPGAKLGPATRAATGLSLRADDFALIVVARAAAANRGVQRFVVVRTLKGRAPRAMQLRVGDNPATAGRLLLLMLRPTAAYFGTDGAGGKSTPASSPSAGAAGLGASPGSSAPTPGGPMQTPSSTHESGPTAQATLYSYRGQPAYARELPAGSDPATVAPP